MVKESLKILAIDDNKDIRDLLSLVLEKEGYEVATAADGVMGLRLIKENTPQLVLLDMMMPEFSGLDVLGAIRNHKDRKIREVPVIIITAKSAIEDIDQALGLGADSYIVKPFRPSKLVEKVREFLSANAQS